MGTRKPSKPYPAELRERAVRLVREQEAEHASQAAAIRSIAAMVGTIKIASMPASQRATPRWPSSSRRV